MRPILSSLAISSVLVLSGCGGADITSLFDGSAGDDGGGNDGGGGDTGTPDGAIPDSGNPDTQPPCVGLECQQVKCADGGTTSISGVVTTPNGMYPVYNATVWIPNDKVAPLADGVQCEACQAPISGKPLVVATTDDKGAFVLPNAPVGTNIPIVVQLGKWRREATINVTQCTDNVATKDAVRLPKNHQEGHLPLIALAAGCDRAECTLAQRIGIDPIEFTAGSGNGRVHVYSGANSAIGGLPANITPAAALWGDVTALKKYDLLINACECQPTLKDTMGNGYDALKQYLEAGGRFIGNHYHYNQFANAMQINDQTCKGPADFNQVASWGFVQQQQGPGIIDTGHPRGKAFASWLVGVGASNVSGQLAIGDTRTDVGDVKSPTTRWLSMGNANQQTMYLSFNTPLGQNQQCGRAAFSDLHGRGTNGGGGGGWPASCNGVPAQVPNNEIALTFLFFDVFGCVQDDTKAPIVPPTK